VAEEQPKHSLAEELANCLTHGFGLVLSIAGLVVLIVLASIHGTTIHIVCCCIYGLSLVTLYAASTLYHGCRRPERKHFYRTIDHAAIFVLIAGTYTPFTLINLWSNWGRLLFVSVWTIAILGMIFKVFFTGRFEIVSTGLYIVTGWLAIFAVKPILAEIPSGGIILILMGGFFYTMGVFFYASKRLRYSHAIWHVMVLTGSVCHYIAVMRYVLPS
jgi:channel protein, hemolysin III family